MAQPVIVFDGIRKDKLKLESDDFHLLLHLCNNITGINLSSCKRFVRANKDEMTCYFLMKHAEATVAPDVLAWLHECKQHRETLANIRSSNDSFPLITGYDEWLYPFQTADVHYLITAKRCINANEVGVGKTIELIAACDELVAKHILIVSPKSLMYMWHDEFRNRSFGDISVCDEKSSYKKNEKIRAKLNANARIHIVNYAMLDEKKWPEIYAKKWDVIICDEAHWLKNHKSQRSKSMAKLKSEYLWLATGTPDPNGDVGEIFGLLHILDPKRFNAYWPFVDRYADVMEEDIGYDREKKRVLTNKKIVGLNPMRKEAFHRLLIPYMLRRTKSEVHKELPAIIPKTIPIEMTSYERKLYDSLFEDMIAQLEQDQWIVTQNVLDRNSKLRQLVLSPALVGGKDESSKTEALLELIENTPGQIIVFSYFKKYIKYLEEVFQQKKIKALQISSDMSPAEIRGAEVAFQSDPSNKVIYGTIRKMGEGLNLQNAQALIFTDKSYVPKDNIQAVARIHRPGLTTNPLVYTLHTQDSLDDLIEKVLEEKQSSINEIETFQYMLNKLRSDKA